MIFKILYKNGVEDKVEVDTEEVTEDGLMSTLRVIEASLEGDVPARITISGVMIRMSEVARIQVTEKDEE